MKKIVLITNLNVLGGTENNLVSIVSHPAFKSEFEAYIFSGKTPHTTISAKLSRAGIRVIQHNKYACIKMPRFLRDHLFDMQIKAVAPDIIVFWNHVAKLKQLPICKDHSRSIIFFERGTGWRDHDQASMRRFLSSVDVVLSNSKAGRQILEHKWEYTGQCRVLPNAVRPEISGRHVSVKRTPLSRPLRLGIAARLVAYKGVASAVLAARELDKNGVQVSLDIAGSGPELQTLKELCRNLGIQAHFRGAIQDMIHFYEQIDILVCPSIREPFGTVVIEAQARGCPVICSGVDGLTEVVQHGRTGFVVEPKWSIDKYLQYAGNKQDIPELVYSPGANMLVSPKALAPEDIADAVLKMTENPEEYENMSRQAIDFVRSNYNFEKYIKKLKDILNRGTNDSSLFHL